MKIIALLLTLVLAIPAFAETTVVRPAPDFSWESFNGGSKALRSRKNQPVVLIIAPSPKSRAFRKQLKEVTRLFRQFAGREALFVAAFTTEAGVVESDIPFLYARDPLAISAAYGAPEKGFGLAVIGPDTNIDLLTSKVTSGERLRDVIDNSYSRQAIRRK